MKKSRFVRQRNLTILNVLFLASVLLLYETHTGLFLKEFAEHELEKFLPPGAHVAIGNMEGGIFRNLVSENVRIMQKKDTPLVNIERIEINYRLWHALLGKIPLFGNIPGQRKIILFVGQREDDFLKGFFELQGTPKELNVTGYLGSHKDERIFIKGTISEDGLSYFHIAQKKGTMDFQVKIEEKVVFLEGNIHHMELAGLDFVAHQKVRVDLADTNAIKVDIVFTNIIIDYLPFNRDVEMQVVLQRTKDMLGITKFKVGDEIEGYGHLRLTDPNYAFLKWTVTNLEVEDYFLSETGKENVSGTMNGNFTLKGALQSLELLAHAYVQSGNMGDIKFDSFIINLKGKGSLISLYDSRIRKEDGYIILEGEIDLSRLKEGKAFDGVFFNPGDKFFVWEGWSVSKEGGKSAIKAEKYLDEEFNLSFKVDTEEEKEEEEHFLGVEHKVKF